VLTKHIKAIPLQEKPLLSIEEAASMLGIGRSSLYRSIKRGDLPLPLFRINGRYWVARRAVEVLIDGGESVGRRDRELTRAGGRGSGTTDRPDVRRSPT
jgi:excisionase family DNA binding protein